MTRLLYQTGHGIKDYQTRAFQSIGNNHDQSLLDSHIDPVDYIRQGLSGGEFQAKVERLFG